MPENEKPPDFRVDIYFVAVLAKKRVLSIGPATFIVGIVATLAVSLLVSFLIGRKNKKIDMVEALKGVD